MLCAWFARLLATLGQCAGPDTGEPERDDWITHIQQAWETSRQAPAPGISRGSHGSHGGGSVKPGRQSSRVSRTSSEHVSATDQDKVLFEKNTWKTLESDLEYKVDKGQRLELTIHRSAPTESFGFSLGTGTSKALKFVSELKDSGPAIKVLKKFDVIDTIAGQDIKPLSHAEAVDIIRKAGLSLRIAVHRSMSQDFKATKRRSQEKLQRRLEEEPWFIQGDGATVTAEYTEKLRRQPNGAFYLRRSTQQPGTSGSAKYTVMIKIPVSADGLWVLKRRIVQDASGMWLFEGMPATACVGVRLLLAQCKPKLKLPADFQFYDNVAAQPLRSASTKQPSAMKSGRDVPPAGFKSAMSSDSVYEDNPFFWKKPSDTGAGPAQTPVERHPSVSPSIQNIYEMVADDEIDVARPAQSQQVLGLQATQMFLTGMKPMRQRSHAQSVKANVRRAAVERKLWRDLPEVADLLPGLDKKELRRQETIYELGYSERAYYLHVSTLLDEFVQPIYKLKSTLLPGCTWIDLFVQYCAHLKHVSEELCAALEQRSKDTPLVGDISDIFDKHENAIAVALYHYCELNTEMTTAFDDDSGSNQLLADFVAQKESAESAMGLTFNAYLLAPIQRLARYPMILDSITALCADGSDVKAAMVFTTGRWRDIAVKCDERINEVKHWWDLRDIDRQVDYQNINLATPPCNTANRNMLGWKQSMKVWEEDLPKGQRMLLKRGVLKIADLDKKNKIRKKKATEVFLFSDMLMYARVVKTKKTGQTRYLVFNVVHRTLLKAAAFKDAAKDVPVLEVKIHSTSKEPETVYFLASAQAELERWLEAFNPPKADAYEMWEMPEAKVIKDYDPVQYDPDGLTLRTGQLVAIEKKGNDWWLGRILAEDNPFPTSNVSGWFPADCVEEVESRRSVARRMGLNQ